MLQRLYRVLLEPKAKTEDNRRREYILNILLVGTLFLSAMALVSAAISQSTRSAHYGVTSLFSLVFINSIFAGLLVLSKKGFYHLAGYLYVLIFLLFATYPALRWGILLPQPILTYCLIIVIAGVVLEARAAFRVTTLAFAVLMLLAHLEFTGVIRFDTAWMQNTGGYNDVIIYGITFLLVALVSWLSNREIELSLERARTSEKTLMLERNLLEVKVKERTEALERAQVEKMMELNRFAEFGRFTSTLLHDLANPLTSVSMGIEQLPSGKNSKLLKEVRAGIDYMERYVGAARLQLRKQSEIKEFDLAEEIMRVANLLKTSAKTNHVALEIDADQQIKIRGDSIRFNQIIANLIANAIDASSQGGGQPFKIVAVGLQQKKAYALIKVTDRGTGIEPEEITKIFEPFYTTKSTERGTGIGLAITKRLVEEDFNGTITVVSNKRSGTCFTVNIPL